MRGSFFSGFLSIMLSIAVGIVVVGIGIYVLAGDSATRIVDPSAVTTTAAPAASGEPMPVARGAAAPPAPNAPAAAAPPQIIPAPAASPPMVAAAPAAAPATAEGVLAEGVLAPATSAGAPLAGARDVTPPGFTASPRGGAAPTRAPPPAAARAPVDPKPRRYPRVIVESASTLRAGRTEIHLAGIDPPSLDRICTDAEGTPWPCGVRARTALRALLRVRPVECTPEGSSDVADAFTARCRVGGEDLSLWMIDHGWATPAAGATDAARAAGERAVRDKRGLFSARAEAELPAAPDYPTDAVDMRVPPTPPATIDPSLTGANSAPLLPGPDHAGPLIEVVPNLGSGSTGAGAGGTAPMVLTAPPNP